MVDEKSFHLAVDLTLVVNFDSLCLTIVSLHHGLDGCVLWVFKWFIYPKQGISDHIQVDWKSTTSHVLFDHVITILDGIYNVFFVTF